MRLELGTTVRCVDGRLGELADLVVEPVTRRVTHLVVEPRHRHALARLVPVELATAGDGAGLSLRCTRDGAQTLPLVEDFAYLRLSEPLPSDRDWDVGIEHVVAPPTASCEPLLAGPIDVDPHVSITYDRVPKGAAELDRQTEVATPTGHLLGHVRVLVVDGDARITHVVAGRGHLWRRRELAIPVEAVTRIATDSVIARLAEGEPAARPDARAERPAA